MFGNRGTHFAAAGYQAPTNVCLEVHMQYASKSVSVQDPLQVLTPMITGLPHLRISSYHPATYLFFGIGTLSQHTTWNGVLIYGSAPMENNILIPAKHPNC